MNLTCRVQFSFFFNFAVSEIWQILETLVEFTLFLKFTPNFLSVGGKNSTKENTLVGSLSVFLFSLGKNCQISTWKI